MKMLGSASLGQACCYTSRACGCTSLNSSPIVSHCVAIVCMFSLCTRPSFIHISLCLLHAHASRACFPLLLLIVHLLLCTFHCVHTIVYLPLSSIVWTPALSAAHYPGQPSARPDIWEPQSTAILLLPKLSFPSVPSVTSVPLARLDI